MGRWLCRASVVSTGQLGARIKDHQLSEDSGPNAHARPPSPNARARPHPRVVVDLKHRARRGGGKEAAAILGRVPPRGALEGEVGEDVWAQRRADAARVGRDLRRGGAGCMGTLGVRSAVWLQAGSVCTADPSLALLRALWHFRSQSRCPSISNWGSEATPALTLLSGGPSRTEMPLSCRSFRRYTRTLSRPQVTTCVCMHFEFTQVWHALVPAPRERGGRERVGASGVTPECASVRRAAAVGRGRHVNTTPAAGPQLIHSPHTAECRVCVAHPPGPPQTRRSARP